MGATESKSNAKGADARDPLPQEPAPPKDSSPAQPGLMSQLRDFRNDIRFSRSWLIILLLLTLVLVLWMIRAFFIPIILAAVFTGLAYPMHAAIVRGLGGRRNLGAIISVLILVTVVAIPLYILIQLVYVELVSLYSGAIPELEKALERGNERWVQEFDALRVRSESIGLALPNPEDLVVDWQAVFSTAGNVIPDFIRDTSLSGVSLIFNLFIVLFTMFYFFRDGSGIIARLRYLSPLDDGYEDYLIRRLISASRGTLRGSLILGFVQGGAGALVLILCGVPLPWLWGMAIVVLSVIPLVGGWLVMYPLGLLQLFQGNTEVAVVIFLSTLLVISNIDNVLRPRLVGRDTGMHDLVVLFATLGGIQSFGLMGFIVGPILAAFGLALLDIYAEEFKPQLDKPARRSPRNAPQADA